MYPFLQIGSALIPTYFLGISLGYCVGLIMIVRRAQQLSLSHKTALDLSLILMIGGFIGSRLFHVIYEYPEVYLRDPWQIFRFWQGGFVFYGGVLLAFPLCYLLVERRRENFDQWLRAWAPIVPVVYAIGRFATFLSGSGYGSPTSLPWGVVYPPGTEAPAGVMVHPTQLYAMIGELIVLAVVLLFEKKKWLQKFNPFWIMVFGHAINRIVVEQFRSDFRGAEFLHLSVSSWISVALIATSVTMFFRHHKN